MQTELACATHVSTAEKLKFALISLTDKAQGSCPTIKELCEAAGVSRSAVYRYHRDILEELYSRKGMVSRTSANSLVEIARLRTDVAALKERTTQLATLVDRYYSAWRESEEAVSRLNREIAELRRLKVVGLGVVR